MNKHIKKIAVIGSGIMGSGIACHFANIGVQVLLLDIVPRELNEIEKAVLARNEEIEFTKVAEAREYRETLALLETQKNGKSTDEVVEEKFPAALV